MIDWVTSINQYIHPPTHPPYPYLVQPSHVIIVMVRQQHRLQPFLGPCGLQSLSEQGRVARAAFARLILFCC